MKRNPVHVSGDNVKNTMSFRPLNKIYPTPLNHRTPSSISSHTISGSKRGHGRVGAKGGTSRDGEEEDTVRPGSTLGGLDILAAACDVSEPLEG